MQVFTENLEIALRGELPLRAKWTRAELENFEEMGLLNDRKYELIEGELYDRMGKNRPQIIALKAVAAWLGQTFGHEYVEQESIVEPSVTDARINRPEPDLVVLRNPSLFYTKDNLRPSDVRLLVEISDSTAAHDLKTKAAVYARAGIEEYWVLDSRRRRLVAHRDSVAGEYRMRTVIDEHESIAPMSAPDKLFPVAHALLPIE